MAIAISGVTVELREVVLRNKPAEMLLASPKGTVPVLVLPDSQVIDESIEIMRWAFSQRALESQFRCEDQPLIAQNDGPFKAALDRYKYPHRFGLADGSEFRNEGLQTVIALDNRLQNGLCLSGDQMGFTDIAIAPFVRQFIATDADWFADQELGAVTAWLDRILQSTVFETAMVRHQAWVSSHPVTVFP